MQQHQSVRFPDKTVLIMEDDMILTLSLELMLKRVGIQSTYRARTGEEALELVEEHPVDLIIADIYLGEGILGTKAVYIMQQTRDIPAIYITGNSDQQNRDDADQTSYIDYLVKPITSDQLYRSLEKVWLNQAAGSGSPTETE
ncbi:MAG: response regulator [Bacteroidota bacterium]